MFYVHPESNEQINDDGRSHGEERNINKIFADGGGGNAHFFANGAANTKYLPLNKMFYAVHSANLK